MGNGDDLVMLRELDDLLQLPVGTCVELMKRGIFQAFKVNSPHPIWMIHEEEVAMACDRILRYRGRQPFYPQESCTIEEAAEALLVTPGAIYGMGRAGILEWAENEHWKFPTRLSVNVLCHRKGLKDVSRFSEEAV